MTSTLASKDTGSLDDGTVNSAQVRADTAAETALFATVAETTAATAGISTGVQATEANSPVDSVTTAHSYITGLVQTSNVVSNAYAVEPSTTIVTTDAQGQTTTQYLWYITPSNTAESETSAIETLSSHSKETTEISVAASVSSTRRADEPITIMTTTNSAGDLYTTTIWWLPSTTTLAGAATSGSDSVEISRSTKSVLSTSYSESLYLTTSGSKVMTMTSTYATTLLQKVVSNTTATVHSNSTNAALMLQGSADLGIYVAAAAAGVMLIL